MPPLHFCLASVTFGGPQCCMSGHRDHPGSSVVRAAAAAAAAAVVVVNFCKLVTVRLLQDFGPWNIIAVASYISGEFSLESFHGHARK